MTSAPASEASGEREILLAEYKALWDYYHRLFGEWTTITERYFKIVTLPAAAVAFLLVRNSQPLPTDILVATLFVIFLIGLGLYVTYAKECGNANYYEAAMERIRRRLTELTGREEAGALNEFRGRRRPGNFGGIKVWRSTTIALLNAGVGTAAVALALGVSSPGAWVVKYIALLLSHILAYQYFVSRYDSSLPGTTGTRE